jgi:Lon protease-like protein
MLACSLWIPKVRVSSAISLPALAALPLFPLPQTVLFPGALLPLHVFEPRYRALVRDALSSHRMLSVVLITDPSALDENGNPAIAPVAGVGVIIDHADLPGGRYNILLRGRARVALRELPFAPPYRRAAASVIESTNTEVPQGDVMALVSMAGAFAGIVRERDKSFDFHIPRDSSPGLIADLCAHHLVLDARERQAILETADAGARVQRVSDVLALQRLTLSGEPRDMN